MIGYGTGSSAERSGLVLAISIHVVSHGSRRWGELTQAEGRQGKEKTGSIKRVRSLSANLSMSLSRGQGHQGSRGGIYR